MTKISKYYFLTFCFLFCLFSCSLEREINLGDNYYLLGDFENTVISIEVENKEGVYEDILLGEIKKYQFDDSFIIIKRQINNKVIQLFQSHPLWETQSGNGIQYWIINKSNHKLFGPFELSHFKSKLKDLHTDLVIND